MHPLSKFLPNDFDPAGGITLLSGRGTYPKLLAERAKNAGINLSLIAIQDEIDEDLLSLFPKEKICWIKIGQLGKFLNSLKKLNSKYFIMAGQVAPKRLFSGFIPDLKAAIIWAKLKEKNAHTIFGAIADEAQKIGVQQLDARSFMDDQLASKGILTGKEKNIDPFNLEYGIKIAKECARLDIGQGVVVSNGTVTAVEAYEGTDNMLKRCAEIPKKNPLYIKTVKPNHDYRFDVPCFGLRTLESMQQGGISCAALETNNVIILEKEKVIAEAKNRGITLFGY